MESDRGTCFVLHLIINYQFRVGRFTAVCLLLTRVVANLKYGDGLAAPDMICSTAFDRDDQFFATAGASRHIKVACAL